MLESYFKFDGASGDEGTSQHKRLLAVQAALEIVKASAGAASSSNGGSMYHDLTHAAEQIEKLADAIQNALEDDNE